MTAAGEEPATDRFERAVEFTRRRHLVPIVAAVAVVALLVRPVTDAVTGGTHAAVGASVPSGVQPGIVSGTSTNTATYDGGSRHLTFDLPAFSGGHVSSASVAGHPTVINFYASWCTVCQQELPAFQAVSRRAGAAAIFVGVNPQLDDNDAQQAQLIGSTGVTYATVRDHDQKLLNPFDTSGSLPVTLFVRADGTVADAHLGGLTDQTLTALLASDLGVHV